MSVVQIVALDPHCSFMGFPSRRTPGLIAGQEDLPPGPVKVGREAPSLAAIFLRERGVEPRVA